MAEARRRIDRPRQRVAALMALFAVLLLAIHASAQAPRTIRLTGDRLSGFVLPVEPSPGEIVIQSLRGWAWTVDDTKRLYLDGDVTIRAAGRLFTAESAVVWLNRLPSDEGLINQIALYFSAVENPTGRAGLSVSGDDLLITGSTRGQVVLRVATLQRQRPADVGLIRRGERRLAEHLSRLLAEPPALQRQFRVDAPPAEGIFAPEPGETLQPQDYALPERVALPAVDEQPPWLRDPTGAVTFTAETIDVVPGEDENTITATGGLVLEYFADDGDEQIAQMTLMAERAVIFTDPGSVEEMAAWELEASTIRGIYLEGNVSVSVNDGAYHLRARRVYYDFTVGRAIMLDAVLRTYVREDTIPLYARAKEMRQISEDQWTARRVRVTTSEFHTGHVALGAERMTVTRRPVGDDPEGPADTYIDARDVTLRAGGVPFFYWPGIAGSGSDSAIRSINLGTRDNDGVQIETVWDLLSLLGVEQRDGFDAALRLDGYTKRGAGAGVEFTYDVADGYGEIELYGMYDDGVDRTSTGREVNQDEAFRGFVLTEHQQELGEDWLFQQQLSYISDESFITSWREDEFRERREYETSAYLKHQKDRAALTLLAKYSLNDFLSNDYLLASQQYTTDRLPELGYHRFGDSWFDAITYSSETRFSRMRFVFDRSTPEELGIRGRAFGIDEDEQLSDVLRGAGLETQFVNRFDTRHEWSWPSQLGIFDVTPFVVGRFTIYDDDFDSFSSESDSSRIFAATGVRVGTLFQRVDNSVENRLLDLHRLRHLIEPSMTLWYGYADVSQDDLPIYDLEVESLATGVAARFGLRNVWQTQRGGPGRWYSVDVLTLDSDLVLTSSDVDRESPAPQFFDYRPEYSQLGDHFRGALQWLLSDSLALVGEATYDLDESVVARGSIGAELRHSPVLTTFIEYRYLDASRNELLEVGWSYQMTPKYSISVAPQWDFQAEEFRSLRVRLTRSFPDFDFIIQVRHDQIRDDTTFGASLGLVEF